MNIPFCRSTAFKINAPGLIEKVYVECEKLFGLKLNRNNFPGPQPVTIEFKDIETLSKNEYSVCEKSDGERYILLLLNIDCKPMCFMINRNNDFLFMDLSIKKEVFEGSIFDGELIKTKKGDHHYLIHDCFCYNGTSFLESRHDLRYACIIDFITKRYVNRSSDALDIKTKLFYKFGPEIKKTWKHITETTENVIDGLIFTPVNGPVIFNRDPILFKWKEVHTMDLQVKKVENEYHYFGITNKELYLFKKYSLTSQSGVLLTAFIKKHNIKLINNFVFIVEFTFNLETEVLTPYRHRSDKKFPNSKITIDNTLTNIEENITIEDLYFNYSEQSEKYEEEIDNLLTKCTI